jgi:chemotaxis protein MotA
MFLIVGYVIILASALGTYALHGSLLALWVPTEYVAIIGLTIGGFVAGNDIKVIKATVGALPGILKGSKYNKAFYVDAAGHAVRNSRQGAQRRPDVDRGRYRKSRRQSNFQ